MGALFAHRAECCILNTSELTDKIKAKCLKEF